MIYSLEGVETERLKFRLLKESDFETWLPLFYSKDAARFLAMDAKLSPKEHCEIWFTKVFNRYENNLGGLNVLIDKKTNQFIGQCGLLVQTVQDQKHLEIGYSILPKYWGKGYATEAAIKCKKEAFDQNFANELISIVHIENIGSAKVAQKNGMKIIKSISEYHGMPINMFGIKKDK